MDVVPLPDNNWADVQWTFDVPQQVNTSEWTGRRQVLELPGAPRWRVSAAHVPLVGESEAVPWRGFLAALRGSRNAFRMPATEGGQAGLALDPVTPAVGRPALANLANTTLGPGLIVRTLPPTGTWDAGARSVPGFGSGLRLSFTVGQANSDIIAGLSPTPSASVGEADILNGWFLRSDGTALVRSAGVDSVLGPYAAGDRFAMAYDGTTLAWTRNGALASSATVAAGQTLYLDTSFKAPGELRAIAFGVPAAAVTALPLVGLPPSATFLRRGQLLTVALANGREQLVTLTDDVVADAWGWGVAQFEAPLRAAAAANAQVAARAPWALVALDSPSTALSVDRQQVYTLTFAASEVF